MRRSRILVAGLIGLGLVAAPTAAALAQTYPSTIVVPAPSASPSTVVAPAPSGGTTVITPPGSTIVVHPPASPRTAVIPVTPWCGGAYASPGGTNFGGCPR